MSHFATALGRDLGRNQRPMTRLVQSGWIATLHPLDVDTLPRLELLDACLQAVPDAVLVSDVNGRAVYLNHAAEDLSGWSSSHAIGKLITEIWRADGEATESALKSPAASFKHAGLWYRLAQR